VAQEIGRLSFAADTFGLGPTGGGLSMDRGSQWPGICQWSVVSAGTLSILLAFVSSRSRERVIRVVGGASLEFPGARGCSDKKNREFDVPVCFWRNSAHLLNKAVCAG
jgi:hypothetical protein